MSDKIVLFLMNVITFAAYVRSDYECLCNYNVWKGIYLSASEQGQPIGYMYEFDCKPIVSQSAESDDWIAIAFEHQKGYVFKDVQTRVQSCSGESPSGDKPTTVTKPYTTTIPPTETKEAITTTTEIPPTAVLFAESESASTTTGGQVMCPLAVQQQAQQEGSTLFINSYSRTCYELVPYRRTWISAEKDCQSKGGHLATIGNLNDEEMVYNYVKSYAFAVWIGLHDRNNEETFEWSSGEPVVYLRWHAGRKNPFLHMIQDCVAMGPLTGTWEDMDCLDRYSYICEFAMMSSSTIVG